MIGKNYVYLVGKIVSTYKFGRSQNGNEYVSFVLLVQGKTSATTTEHQATCTVSVMCFKPSTIKYLKEVGVKYGSNVIVDGFVSSYKKEIKGKEIVINTVTANDIYAILTPQKAKTKLEQEQELENNGEDNRVESTTADD